MCRGEFITAAANYCWKVWEKVEERREKMGDFMESLRRIRDGTDSLGRLLRKTEDSNLTNSLPHLLPQLFQLISPSNSFTTDVKLILHNATRYDAKL
jgi:hypothetical protein